MDKVVVYIHGKGGNSNEAFYYDKLFKDADVIGFDYKSNTPWQAKEEFSRFYDEICKSYSSVEIIANSIGAFFAMSSLYNKKINQAYFISPVVDMEKLILDMMSWGNITEEQLSHQKEIQTDFGETLSWQYLCYVRKNPVNWKIPTHILYGDQDHLTSYETIFHFANKTHATLTVMKGGEHWFHTKKQMDFLNQWVKKYI